VADFVGTKHLVDRTAGSIIEALADPTRRQIVSLLSHGPRRAGELAAEVGMSAPAVSRHLRVLLSAEVITDERIEEDARARIFRVRPEAIKAARDWLDSVLSGTVGLKVNGYE
jgi:DNA-binding transcriptional ArsR family regulator